MCGIHQMLSKRTFIDTKLTTHFAKMTTAVVFNQQGSAKLKSKDIFSWKFTFISGNQKWFINWNVRYSVESILLHRLSKKLQIETTFNKCNNLSFFFKLTIFRNRYLYSALPHIKNHYLEMSVCLKFDVYFWSWKNCINPVSHRARVQTWEFICHYRIFHSNINVIKINSYLFS